MQALMMPYNLLSGLIPDSICPDVLKMSSNLCSLNNNNFDCPLPSTCSNELVSTCAAACVSPAPSSATTTKVATLPPPTTVQPVSPAATAAVTTTKTTTRTLATAAAATTTTTTTTTTQPRPTTTTTQTPQRTSTITSPKKTTATTIEWQNGRTTKTTTTTTVTIRRLTSSTTTSHRQMTSHRQTTPHRQTTTTKTTTTTTTRIATLDSAAGDFCYEGNCFYAQTTPATAEQAIATCSVVQGGLVAIPTSTNLMSQMAEAMRSTGVSGHWWIGLVSAPDCSWISYVSGAPATYVNWGPSFLGLSPALCLNCTSSYIATDTTDGSRCCAVVAPELDAVGNYWKNVPCDDVAAYFVSPRARVRVVVPAGRFLAHRSLHLDQARQATTLKVDRSLKHWAPPLTTVGGWTRQRQTATTQHQRIVTTRHRHRLLAIF